MFQNRSLCFRCLIIFQTVAIRRRKKPFVFPLKKSRNLLMEREREREREREVFHQICLKRESACLSSVCLPCMEPPLSDDGIEGMRMSSPQEIYAFFSLCRSNLSK